METNDVMLRHLLDLCRKSEKTGTWQYSGFLSPAEQDDLLSSREAAGFSFRLEGGYEAAERKILAAGNEMESGPPELPLSVVAVAPKSEKYAEELTHRDYLGAILGQHREDEVRLAELRLLEDDRVRLVARHLQPLAIAEAANLRHGNINILG